MAHRRKPVAAAFYLNTFVTAVEVAGGMASHSLSLIVDGIHNISDEAALLMLLLAYALSQGISRRFVLAANLFNSIGLGTVTAYMVLRSVERINTPKPVLGLVPVLAGVAGALGNWGIARVLRSAANEDAAIRLSYVHNLGDTLLSMAPVAAGILVLAFNRSIFDPIVAILIACFILTTTASSLLTGSHQELMWPDNIRCAHSDADRVAN
jgi:cation diffusion facilitator family transporter